MREWLGTLLAIALPWLTGSVGWLLLMKRPREAHDWALILGYGYIVGILLTTLGMRLLDALGLTQRFLTIATALVGLGGMGLWVVHKKFQKIYPTVSGQQDGYFFFRRTATLWIFLDTTKYGVSGA
jgi:hypothetical protein